MAVYILSTVVNSNCFYFCRTLELTCACVDCGY